MYSCLKVILDILDKLLKPDSNALLHEFGFQVSIYVFYLVEIANGNEQFHHNGFEHTWSWRQSLQTILITTECDIATVAMIIIAMIDSLLCNFSCLFCLFFH